VLAKWRITTQQLIALTPELHRISLGITAKIWRHFYMGADLIVRPDTATDN
jgi:hypothetical protein